jgi:hypothetical protein
MLSQLGHLTLHRHHRVLASSRLVDSWALQVTTIRILDLQSFQEQDLLSNQPSWLEQFIPYLYLYIMPWAGLVAGTMKKVCVYGVLWLPNVSFRPWPGVVICVQGA